MLTVGKMDDHSTRSDLKSDTRYPTGWKGTNLAHVEIDAMKNPMNEGFIEDIIKFASLVVVK